MSADAPATGWTAIVLAGQRPGVDPLASAFGQSWKALVAIDGRPMVARVVDTLLAAPEIARIVILAQQPSALLGAVPNDPRITFAASASGISASILNVAGQECAPWPIMVTTADHPLLNTDMIADFLRGAQGNDLAIGMVERAVLSAAYPSNQRTWLKFSDGHWSGANLFALNNDRTYAALTLWAEAEQDRKKAWKLFCHFGLWLALRALTRTIGLADGLARAGQRLGLTARLVPLSQAEAAIDVDKVSDHELVETIISKQISSAATRA